MLQIIGTKKCPETRKVLRFCKERSIAHQFVDLNERGLSDGEWEKVFHSLDPASLVDDQSKFFQKEGYAWRAYDPVEELKEHVQLLKTPLLKYKQRVAQGFDTDFIESYMERA